VAEEIKKSIYTHTSTRTLAGGIVLLFAQNPAELLFPLPIVFYVYIDEKYNIHLPESIQLV
jgi:hypothetical protein